MKYLSIFLMLFLLVSCQEKKLDRFERETREFTLRHCPKAVDEITTLDSLVFRNDGTLDYYYYYSAKLTDELRTAFLDRKDDIRETSLASIRNSIELKAVKEAGLNIIYSYIDTATGREIVRYTFTKEDYQ